MFINTLTYSSHCVKSSPYPSLPLTARATAAAAAACPHPWLQGTVMLSPLAAANTKLLHPSPDIPACHRARAPTARRHVSRFV